ncbi:MAG: TlyA family RNA methyltransferase [Dehalococcoidia bacterium]|jgi:23S rRNA (cytidine1920-2'-O)/16S rRNA (cytidine1409-2'-O)-methyltransferase
MKRRIDVLLVERGLAESREKAQALIMAGEVYIDNVIAAKPSIQIPTDSNIRIREKLPFVGRGGVKLAHALTEFNIDTTSLVAADIGASTGGFTDCMLQHGASKIYAVDVGYGQIDYKLRVDPRVVVIDRTNARYPLPISEQIDIAAIDVSFISLEKIVPNVAAVTKQGGRILCLVKPQFEAGKALVEKGGLVKDPLVHAGVLGKFISWSINKGYRIIGLTSSPIYGSSGNREFFVLLRVYR